MKLEQVIRCAEGVLRAKWGACVRLGAVRELSEARRRHRVVLCEVLDGPADGPATVVVKKTRATDYRPDDPHSPAGFALLRDWAGLEFLGTPPGWQNSPKFYGGDRAAGLIVMEDLTALPDLESVLSGTDKTGTGSERMCADTREEVCREVPVPVLLGPDRRRAAEGLLLMAETLGRLHALTIGRAAEYQALRDALGPGDDNACMAVARNLLSCAPGRGRERLRELGVQVSGGFLPDVQAIAAALADPGPFLVYTHGDPAPENCRLAGDKMGTGSEPNEVPVPILADRLYLLDYGYGGFRHALVDGVFARMRFPTGMNSRDLPEPLVADMEAAYRRELAKGCPAAGDDVSYGRAVADACGYWMIDSLARLLLRAPERGMPGGHSLQPRVLPLVAAFLAIADRCGRFPGLRETTARLLDRLDARACEKLPMDEAFRD